MNGMVVSLQILFVCIYCVDDNYFLLDVTYDIIEWIAWVQYVVSLDNTIILMRW